MYKLLMVLSVVLGTSLNASAGMIVYGDVHSKWGEYLASVEYTFDALADEGTLTVTLDNVSDPSNGGYITGFLFNIDGDAIAELDGGEQHNLVGVTDESGSPYGTFEAGAALREDFLGGGKPSLGIGIDDGAVSFTFTVTGADAATLIADS